jgi:nucleoside-diphosphate-sugar epimerase
LVLGASGFVGRALLRELATLPAGSVAVRALLRRPDLVADQPFLEKVAGSLESTPSILAPSAPYVLVHLAVKQLDSDGTGFDATNVEATRAMLTSLRTPPSGILYGSSMSVYGQGAQDGVSEDAPLVADTPLGRSRALAEHEVGTFGSSRGVPAFAMRPRFVLGEGDRFVLPGLAKLARRRIALGTGEQRFSILDVADYARVIVLLARHALHSAPGPRAFNVGYARPVSFREIGDTLARALDAKAPRFHVPVSRTITRALRSVGAASLATRLELVGLSHWGDVRALTDAIGGSLVGQDPLPVLARAATRLSGLSSFHPPLTVLS